MPSLIDNFLPHLINQLNTSKTLIIKTALIFLQELFFSCKSLLSDQLIYQLENQIMKKIFSVNKIVKKEAEGAYSLLI